MNLIFKNIKALEEFGWELEVVEICLRETLRFLEEETEERYGELRKKSWILRKGEAENELKKWLDLYQEESEYYRKIVSIVPYWLRILSKERLILYASKVKKYQREIIWLNNAAKGRKTEKITPEMIERAREYPFSELIELKKNFALCPFHKEKTPSFYVKNNRAHCFGCGKSWDTIAFVMERDNLTFTQAVKFLACIKN